VVFSSGWEDLFVFKVIFERDAACQDSREFCIVHGAAAAVSGKGLFDHLFRNPADAGG